MIAVPASPRILAFEANRLVRTSALAVGLWGPMRAGVATDRMRRSVLLHLVDGTRAIARSAGEKLVAGVKDVAGWFAGFKALLTVRHEAAALIVAGRPDPETPTAPIALPDALRDPLRRRSNEQWAYLAGFAAGVLSGKVPLDGQIVTRAEMYARATWGVAEKALRDAIRSISRAGRTALMAGNSRINREFHARFAGMTLERRELAVANHCEDCPELAAMGWQPIGTLPDIGDTICGPFCHCYYVFK